MEMSEKIYKIDLGKIEVSRFNVRSTDPEVGIADLMKSIKRHGLLQPVVLRGELGDPPYELIVGQRRFLAHQKLGKSDIKAVFAGDISDEDAEILSLIENVHRKELNHADRARTITALYLRLDKSVGQVAQELGLSEQTVREDIKIEELATEKAKSLLSSGKIKRQDVKRVIDAAQGDSEKADRLLDEMPKLSLYEKDRAVDYGRRHPKALSNEIIEDAKISRIQPTIILSLPPEIEGALVTASKKLSMGFESIAKTALSEWLVSNGFLKRRS